MSSPYSAESAESTSDLSEPGCASSDNANQTRQPDKSLPGIGPTPPATPTLPDSTGNGSQVMAFNSTGAGWWNGPVSEMAALRERNHKGDSDLVIDALHGPTGSKEPLILSAEASPAKTSQSQENEPVLPGKDQDSSMKQHESQTLFSGMGDGSSLRTYPDCFPATEALTSGSFSRRWPTSGFTTSPGELWTADTSECHNGGGAYSSLPGVLEATVPERFYLSQKAAAGILRRAEKRGRALPPTLDRALRTLSTEGKADPTITQRKPTTVSQEAA
jgi:hypothetical protein